jgi:hypothetical protein
MFEINLVPDIKRETLHRKRIRNLILFACIVVAAGCAGILIILGGILTGQTVVLSGLDEDLSRKSNNILSFTNADQLLTIQAQLKNIDQIDSSKHISSRIFGVLDVILPGGDGARDTVQISDATLDLTTGVITFTAKADSTPEEGFTAGIHWRALDAFKNIVLLSRYDYGRYIDSEGNEILARCVDEESVEGVIWGVYRRNREGCQEGESEAFSDVRIKRDMTEDELVAAEENGDYYFQSECMTFVAGVARSSCELAPAGVENVVPSNSRDSSGRVVLGFTARITLPVEIFSFQLKHLRVIGPTRQNVTDSYQQIRDMFDGVTKCSATDRECQEANNV